MDEVLNKLEFKTVDELDDYLYNLGYTVITTTEYDRLTDIVSNHPG